jgi:hypothetical protein
VTHDGIGIWSFAWVFPQDKSNKASHFGRASLHLEILCDYLGEVVLVPDVEGVLASEKLVRQCSDGPSVDFLVVLLSAENFRRKVERGAAESGPKLTRAVHRPSEIANFGHSLNVNIATWERTMFSSFKSR